MQEINKFHVKRSAIPDGLEEHMAFRINKNFVFIDSIELVNSSLNELVKNLSDNDFEYFF